MNTKTCLTCDQINPIQQAFCHSCGKPFAKSAPNNYGGQPNFQNQPNHNYQPNNFQPQFSQPKKSGNKTLWWILGGVLAGLGLISVLILFMLGIFVAVANDNDTNETDTTETKTIETKTTETKPTLEGTRWRAQDGRTYTFGTNKRVTLTSPDGSQTFNGDLKIDGQIVRMKMDLSPTVTAANWSISGNKLTLFNPQIGTTDVVTRIE